MTANGMPPDNWIYIQEPDVRIGRLQVFNNWSPSLVANPDTVWLGLEYFCREGDDLWGMDDGRFVDFAGGELEKIGMIDRQDVLDGTLIRVPKAYPAYFGEYSRFNLVRDYSNVTATSIHWPKRHAPVQQSGSFDARATVRSAPYSTMAAAKAPSGTPTRNSVSRADRRA